MVQELVKLSIPFESLVGSVAELNLDEKRRLWELLEEQLAQAEEAMWKQEPAVQAEIKDARATYQAGDYVTAGMTTNKTLTVLFDGQVLHPESPLNLEPDTHYIITIQSVPPPTVEGDAWDVLDELTGTLEAPHDWASEHDHYLYGTPRRQGETAA